MMLVLVGFGFGLWAEQRHFRSIVEREKLLADIAVLPERFPPPRTPAPESRLVSGSVVVSVDYFKRVMAGVRALVGGHLNSYESLLERGRREALLRMKEEARRLNASEIFNVKVETASISKGAGNSIGSVEVYAYGTAFISRGGRIEH
jgi:uncharacterized protein YbjQ (UPF0145 family)